MIETLAVHGYRSLRDVVLPLGRVTVVTGENGSGKSSLYRALGLLARTAEGRLVSSLAHEGGLPAVVWAGPETISGAMKRGEVPVQGASSRRRPVSLMMGFHTDELGYLVDVGLPTRSPTMFDRDPIIKREAVFAPPVLRRGSVLVDREGPVVTAYDGRSRDIVDEHLDQRRSMVGDLVAADAAPELRVMRDLLRGWRFHDSFRVDADAPARRPQVGTWTPVLADDGSDLAPAVQTILESAWADQFSTAIDAAFPGSVVSVKDSGGAFRLELSQPGLLRPLGAHEVSDGTLRFLLLATALLSPQPPSLMVLNEPESSLHPDLLAGLADLIAAAGRATQIVVVSHSTDLVARLEDAHADSLVHHVLTKQLGETVVSGQGRLDRPSWDWGSR